MLSAPLSRVCHGCPVSGINLLDEGNPLEVLDLDGEPQVLVHLYSGGPTPCFTAAS